MLWQHTGNYVLSDWSQQSYIIDSYNNEDIDLECRLTTDGSITYAGFYIDDVKISAVQ